MVSKNGRPAAAGHMHETASALDPDTFFRRPDACPLEFSQDGLDLVPMSRETYQQSLFMDRGRIIPAARRGWHLPLPGLLDEFERRRVAQRPINFIFHIAHCGSTLLARAMDVPARTLVLREPFPLRQLGAEAAATPSGPRDPAIWRRCLALTGALLGRRYDPDEAVIVKANVPVNFMLGPLMGLHPESRGVLLYADLERYVMSVLKTPMHRRWVGNVSAQIAGGIRATKELAAADQASLTTAERAACLWAVQMLRFRAALAGNETLRSLDCEALFASPEQTLGRCFDHFGLALPAAAIEAIANGELFRRHAKDPRRAYDRGQRDREFEHLRTELDGDLEQARSWIQQTGLGDLVMPTDSAV